MTDVHELSITDAYTAVQDLALQMKALYPEIGVLNFLYATRDRGGSGFWDMAGNPVASTQNAFKNVYGRFPDPRFNNVLFATNANDADYPALLVALQTIQAGGTPAGTGSGGVLSNNAPTGGSVTTGGGGGGGGVNPIDDQPAPAHPAFPIVGAAIAIAAVFLVMSFRK